MAAGGHKPNLGESLAKLGETMANKAGDKKLAAKSHAQGKAARKKSYKLKPVPKDKGGLSIGKVLSHAHPPDPIATLGELTHVPTPQSVGKSALRTLKNAGVALVEAPGPTLKHTATGLRDIAAATPAGVVAAATTRPDKTLKKIVDDYEERYGQSDKEQVKRFKAEGLAAELLDASSLLSAGGATSGRALAKSAAKGVLGPRAKAVVTDARPALRTTGGKATPQPKSRNYFRAEVQVARDKRLAGKLDKASRVEPLDAVRALAHEANDKAGKVVEVVPSARKVAKAQRVAVATTKGRAVGQLKSEQTRLVEKTARRLINQFDKHERDAFYYVGAGIVSPDPARAVQQLARRRDSILKARAARDIPAPTGLRRKTDEVAKIDGLLQNVDKAFTPRVRDTAQALRAVDIHVGRQDPTLTAQQRLLRRYSQQAETLGIRHGETDGQLYNPDEPVSAYIKRVRTAADAEGLERPLYFPSEKYALADNPDFASRAVGGARAAKRPFKYTGELFRTGRQDTTPEVFLTGLARTIKRKHNWRLVADTLDEHAIGGLTNMKMGQLKERLTDMGVAPSGGSVAYWHPGLYRKLMGNTAALAGKNLDETERAALLHEGEDFGAAQSQRALQQSLLLDEQVTPELAAGGGWSAIPRAAYNEIMEAAKPSGRVGRAWDIGKSKQSRVLLGLGNIPWLGFQVASNAFLAAGATHGRSLLVKPLVDQARWYHGLSTEQRDLVDSLVGDSASHSSAARPHMGAAASGRLINEYRALKANPIWDRQLKGRGPSVRQLNPIEGLFALDRGQNNAFRRAVLHDKLKRTAAQQMAHDIDGLHTVQTRVTQAIKGAPDEVVNGLLKNREVMEAHAKYVDDWLGNWTTFTAAERHGANRYIMFYPYLRFSLKLAFYTLPTQHPLLLSIAAKLGQLQQEELRRLGVADLPWARGRLYFERGGKLHQIDLGRANPAMNALTSVSEPSQLVGLLPPVAQTAADQLFHRTSYKDKEWAVNGTPAQYGAQGHDYGLRVRARIALDDLLSLAYPYRTVKSLTQDGPQGDDSLLGSARPVTYKDPKIRAAIEKSIKQKHADRSILSEVLPLLGEVTDDPAVAKTKRERGKPAPKKDRGIGGGGFGGGGFGGGGFGGGGF